MAKQVTAIVLAAGLGTRMKSHKPKVLHAAAGRTLIDHVIGQLSGAGVNRFRVVVGHGGDTVKQHLWGKPGVDFFLQAEQRGTADAVRAAQVESIESTTLIVNGDHPLILSDDYLAALESLDATKSDLVFVSSIVKRPKGFGRVVRDKKGQLKEIVEEKDASPAQKKIREVNSGLYVAKKGVLAKLLPLVKNNNAKKEFYLTDIISMALKLKMKVHVHPGASRVGRGVNTLEELASASKLLYLRKARELMAEGVVIVDPAFTYIDGDVKVGEGTVIGPGTMLASGTQIGKNCRIDGYTYVRASKIGDHVELRWGSHVDLSEIRDQAIIGPYARLRPESIVEREAHVGNFVELKKAILGARSKANHLTYLGDAEIGEDTNIGCGTITCNYAVDRKKYKTKIGKNVFVGSDSQFVAPVQVGDGAIIASGSTITEDVPAHALAVARSRQVIKNDYNKE
ncbi:MAG: bifunctional UDP-N-acetylglucosamine diphosphorylase/glucosamine-1-phosphate N-acetyltransferase GlmU [Oligoflexia bacterium]|nr:bifunctional UDP-N-acetylglucosamine diphosphorylase/glucosamine-1-phosphate N-acetyltransferase GlmU [Oligoflexia bacterium]